MKLELDLSYLNEISDGDKEFIADVLNTFLEEMPKDMAEMNKAVEENNLVMIGKMAHKTKATLQTLGLYDFKEMALKIEQTSKSSPNNAEMITWAKEFMTHVSKLYPIVQKML